MFGRKTLGLAVAAVLLVGCLIIPAWATGRSENEVVSWENLECEVLDLTDVTYIQFDELLRASKTLDVTVTPHAVAISNGSISLRANDTVTFNCSYSPMSASVDFGVLDSNDRFHYMTSGSGSINRTMRVTSAGTYRVAIRNNSSDTITVMGYVNY